MENYLGEIIILIIASVVGVSKYALVILGNRRGLNAQARKTNAEADVIQADADEKQTRVALNIMDLFAGNMAEMVQSIVALTKTVNEKDARLDRMEGKIAEKDKALLLLQTQINELREADAQKTARINALEQQIDHLTKEGHAKDELISRLRQEVNDLTAARAGDQRRIAELEMELETERRLKKRLAELSASETNLMLQGQDSVEAVQQP